MKARQGFVSNSSSSSFVIQKKDLTPEQLDLIRNHMEDEYCRSGEAWEITETDTTIEGYAFMDNFDMKDYLERVGILLKIEWGDLDVPSP